MAANNQGIMHLSHKPGGFPACRNRNGHMSTTLDSYLTDTKPCKKCRKTADLWLKAREKKNASAERAIMMCD